MYARLRAYVYFFPEQECDPIMKCDPINLTLLLKKLCSVHITMFEIVVHRNVDNRIQLLT